VRESKGRRGRAISILALGASRRGMHSARNLHNLRFACEQAEKKYRTNRVLAFFARPSSRDKGTMSYARNARARSHALRKQRGVSRREGSKREIGARSKRARDISQGGSMIPRDWGRLIERPIRGNNEAETIMRLVRGYRLP